MSKLQIAAAATIVAALAMVAARTEPHVGAPNWRPPYRTYWYDPWPLPTGRTPTTPAILGVPAPFAQVPNHHNPLEAATNPPSARFTRSVNRSCDKADP